MKRIITLFLALIAAAVLMTACNKPLALDQTELEMVVGDSAELSAGDAAKVSWSSSNSSIASVNGGLVTAKGVGSAVITASLENGETATCIVNVGDKLINMLTLDVKSARVEIGKTIQLIVSFAPADATDRRVTWSSSDETIAVVNENGYVSGMSEGVASITCKSNNGIEASCTVTVGAPAEPPTAAATLPPATEAPTEAPTAAASASETPTEAGAAETVADSREDSDSGFIFPDSSVRVLSDSEIDARLAEMSGSPLSDSFAQDAVNEIFARNGFIFRTPSISSYYQSQPWYRPDPSYDGSLNSIELANIALLRSH